MKMSFLSKALSAILFFSNTAVLAAESIAITERNLASFLYIGGSMNLSCYGPSRRLGRARPRLVSGAKFRAISAAGMLRALKVRLRSLGSSRRRTASPSLKASKLKLRRRIAELKSAAAACRAFKRNLNRSCSLFVDRDSLGGACSDDNSGAEDRPFCSISRASHAAGAGDVVCIKAGVYRESVTFLHSGKAGNPVTFRAYPPHACRDQAEQEHKLCSVILDGATPLSGPWVKHSDSIYYTELPDGAAHGMGYDSVFENGERLRYATGPNQDNRYFNYGSYHIAQSMDSAAIRDPINLPQENGFWIGAHVKLRDIWSGHQARRISASGPGFIAFEATDMDLNNLDGNKYSFILTNHPALLDQPGEFFIDYENSPKRLYLITLDQQSPEDREISISTLHEAFLNSYYLALQSHIRVEGLEIRKYRAGAIHLQDYYHDQAADFQIVNNFIHDNGDSEGLHWIGGNAIEAQNVAGLLIEDNEIFRNAITAVMLGGKHGAKDVRIRRNKIHYNGADGVHGEARDLLIENNRIYNQFHTDGHQDGLDLYAVDGALNWVVRYNTIFDTTQNIYFGFPGWYKNLTGENVQIYGNILYNKDYPGRGKGIYLANGNSNNNLLKRIDIHSNTIAFQGLIVGGLVDQLVVRNNLLFDSGYGIDIDRSISAPSISSDYNLFYNSPIAWPYGTWYSDLASFHKAQPGQERHSLESNPKLTAPYEFNFTLLADSPAINHGDPDLARAISLPNPFYDAEGDVRPAGRRFDIGADEKK